MAKTVTQTNPFPGYEYVPPGCVRPSPPILDVALYYKTAVPDPPPLLYYNTAIRTPSPGYSPVL